jgi:hypothetical protein
MATWQFSFDIIPNDCLDNYHDDNLWKGSKLNNSKFIKDIKEKLLLIFGLNAEYERNIVYGKDTGLIVNVISDENGLLLSLYIRLNVSKLNYSLGELNKLLAIFTEFETKAIINNNIVELNYDELLKEIEKSKAYNFVLDPKGFLKNKDNRFK